MNVQSSEITFRLGTIEDLDGVTAKVHEFAPKMLRHIGSSEEQVDEWLRFNAARNRWRKRLQNSYAAVIIAERDDLLVGIGYIQTFTDLDGAKAAGFGGLYIRYTRQGIGTAIMEERLRLAKKFKVDYAQLETAETNTVMCTLAEKYGFEVHERYRHTILEDIPFLRYRKALTELGEDRILGEEDGDSSQ
jgi:RimJ/RimL family protein N-acetyltransferase